jgi:hypothetical protein
LASESIGQENLHIKKQEDQLRQLFVQNKKSYRINSPHVLLIDVFEKKEEFTYQPETQEELAIPKVLTKFRTIGKEGSAIVDREQFMKNWRDLTCDVLKGLDWKNVFVAGGIVLGNIFFSCPFTCCSPVFLQPQKTKELKFEFSLS